ncbi:sensor histidine kinase [Nonomuraea soli]|uniref:histidine kinase n=1 Tax=Nonomuraea soli TaxID=1032476 RepID=A0A7W0CH95_9ACTN|nr:histidine kinase [Nonomuraea soli]MBA2891192.1 signal transduction histidine kinase [Nonomuraea soli]
MPAATRLLASVALGALTTPLDLLLVLAALLRPKALTRPAGALAGWHLRRLRLDDDLGAGSPGQVREQVRRYLAMRWPVGLLGAIVLALLLVGLATAAQLAWAWSRGEAVDGMHLSPGLGAYVAVGGFVLLFLNVCGIVGVHALDTELARRRLGPASTEALQRRIAELAHTRSAMLAAVDSERRRIERDLHDGLQQHLVALAMLIGRSRRPSSDPALLAQAHQQAQQALAELREVAWRIYPSGLDSLGLADALQGMAERTPLPVTIRCDLGTRPPRAVEAAAYFVASEAITNAVKHAGATHLTIDVTTHTAPQNGTARVHVTIRDDGRGGADPSGTGLSGLAGRVAALDGAFHLSSPAGGPTTITAVLPCA